LFYLGFAEKVVCEEREQGTGNREQGTGNREQFQELDGSYFSLVSNLNARFSSFHLVKACTLFT
jgi:hypothetical protein